MRILGSFFRYILNINTLWGLMILASFGVCCYQHYAPSVTLIPANRLAEGDNALTVRILESKKNADGELAHDHVFVVTRVGDTLSLRAEDQDSTNDRPWLIEAKRVGPAFVLRWDTHVIGRYEVLIGGNEVARGRLVTLQTLTDAAFSYAKLGFEIALGLVSSMVMLLGLMKVGEHAGIVQLVARVFHPVIRFLFPDVPKDHPASGAILMNWTTTVLGLGNAATPFGLKAVKELESLNPHPGVATDSQVMLLGYNTAGFAILPTALLAVRQAAGCKDPAEIIGTCMVAGAVSTVTAIVMVKLLGKLPFFSVRAAAAELAREQADSSAGGDAAAGNRPSGVADAAGSAGREG